MLTVELFRAIAYILDARNAQSRDSCPRQWRRSNVINEQSASTKRDLPISPETGHPRCLAGETSLASATLTNRPIGIRRNGPRSTKTHPRDREIVPATANNRLPYTNHRRHTFSRFFIGVCLRAFRRTIRGNRDVPRFSVENATSNMKLRIFSSLMASVLLTLCTRVATFTRLDRGKSWSFMFNTELRAM